MLILLNKPYDVLCQFSPVEGRRTLAGFLSQPDVYPAGRLDADSEGLVVLTDDGRLQARISQPRQKMVKTYLVQVDGEPTDEALDRLRGGLLLKDGPTRPCAVRRIVAPDDLWPREPPVRFRRHIPTAWIELCLSEGRNRQVRRMTAAVGFPTLRLIRWQVGPWSVSGLAPGTWRTAEVPRALRTGGGRPEVSPSRGPRRKPVRRD